MFGISPRSVFGVRSYLAHFHIRFVFGRFPGDGRLPGDLFTSYCIAYPVKYVIPKPY